MKIRFLRTVVRFPKQDKEAIDRLRSRYFDETKRGLSRAALVRILVHRGLREADSQRATEIIDARAIARASARNIPPKQRGEEPS